MNVVGFRCAACDAEVPVEATFPWRCPFATPADPHHVLHRVRRPAPFAVAVHPNPLVAYDAESAWAAHAAAHGLDATARRALVEDLDRAVAAVAGTGFHTTPLARSAALSDALGFSARGGVWLKDETGAVAGSHKARHLVGVLLHLLVAERLGALPAPRPPLAIASCGNAALAAAVLAAAVAWPLEVFVPTTVRPAVAGELERLGATVVRCPRRPGDPPGDPCLHRFRHAVAAGAVPFTVQGPENALCLDTGRTLGWEVLTRLVPDRVFVQVGGGALATCWGLAAADLGVHPAVHAVQTEGCAPLARAWERARALGLAAARRQWASCMWPWEEEPRSAATGILDDETYDWLGVVAAMEAGGGGPVVVPEALVVAAEVLLADATGLPADATATAGLAGLLHVREQVGDDERVLVLVTGRRR